MNNLSFDGLKIAEVERDTGISKDALRVWERRYGFPIPMRDSSGERVYSFDQVERLRVIRRLMDQGVRPSKVISQELPDLHRMLDSYAVPPDNQERLYYCRDLLKLLRLHQNHELREGLHRILGKEGLQKFITDTIVPMNSIVGDSWIRGDLSIPEEHLYTEQVQNVIRHAIQLQPLSNRPPKILLTTFPDEEHCLGILMVEAMCVAEGAHCISLGTRMPITDAASYAAQGCFDVVAISFSGAYPARDALKDLQHFRNLLSESIMIWAGGAGLTNKKIGMPNVQVVNHIGAVPALVNDWRVAHAE